MVQDVIRDHHVVDFGGEHEHTIACVKLANMMCTSKDMGSSALPLPPMGPKVLVCLKVEQADIKPLVDQMEKQVALNQELLNMAN